MTNYPLPEEFLDHFPECDCEHCRCPECGAPTRVTYLERDPRTKFCAWEIECTKCDYENHGDNYEEF